MNTVKLKDISPDILNLSNNKLSINDILLQMPTFSKQISNRDFDLSYNYKTSINSPKESFLYFLEFFIRHLYNSGVKCKQTSVTYKFHSFPIIKIFSYLTPSSNIINYYNQSSDNIIREYKTIPNFSPLLKDKINYYLNFFIINGKIHYGLKSIIKEKNLNREEYLYGKEADNILEKISKDKNYNYLSLIKNLQLPLFVIEQLKKHKVGIMSFISEEQNIIFEINKNLDNYNFFSYYNEESLKEELLDFHN